MKKVLIPVFLTFTLAACSSTTTPPAAEMSPPEATSAPEAQAMPTSPAAPDTTKVYSLDEIAKHATPEDCWLTIDGKVYDVTGFGEKHPGGEAVYASCGKDATTLFETRPMGSQTPHSEKARGFLPNFEIGILAQ